MAARTRSLVVVGSGLTGATIARLASDDHYRVVVIERRPAAGGNIRDARHESGLLYGLYGPHYFRTSSEHVWQFVRRFADFAGFTATVTAWSRGGFHPWPLIRTPEWDKMEWRIVERPANFEEACLQSMPVSVYQQFVEGYTFKQWGIDPRELSAALGRRVEVRTTNDRRLKTHSWQGLPVRGYAAMVERMLEGCTVCCDFTYKRPAQTSDLVVFTGSIDEYYGYDLGRLRYRAQERNLIWFDDVDLMQPEVQVNYADRDEEVIRRVEWKHQLPAHLRSTGSLVTEEAAYSPQDPDAYEYPMPSDEDHVLYARYAERSRFERSVVFAGRLGEYRYLDMDQAIARAMQVYRRRVVPMMESASAVA